MNSDTINPYIITKKGLDKDFNSSQIVNYFSASFIKNIEYGRPKNVILNIPYLNSSRKWILFDFILNHMQRSYSDKSERFNIGDCLRITGTRRKIICEFVDYEYEGTEEERIRVKFKDSTEFSSLKNFWAYEKIETQPLSTFKSFSLNEKLFALDKITGKSSNNNFALFDTSIIYVAGINSTLDFIKKNFVEGNPIQKTISWSKTNEEGKIKKLTYGLETEHFNCVVAPTVSSALNTVNVNESQNFNAVFIEDLYYCNLNPDALLDLMDLHIPIIVFSNDVDNQSYNDFCKNNEFQLWHWGMKSIKGLLDLSSNDSNLPIEFYNLKLAFDNYCSKSIDINVVKNNLIETIGSFSISMNNQISEELLSNSIFSDLRKLSLRLSRIPTLTLLDIDLLKKHLIEIETLIEKRNYEIPDSDEKVFKKLLSFFKDFLNNTNHENDFQKTEKLFELIEDNKKRNIAIITSMNQNHRKLEKIILHRCTKRVKVFQSSSSVGIKENFDVAIITGWPAGKNLSRILLCNKFKKIIFLVYPYQFPWLNNIIKSKNNFYSNIKSNSKHRCLNILHDHEDSILPLLDDKNILPEPTIFSNIEESNIPDLGIDILEFEIKLKERRRKAFQSSIDEDIKQFEDGKLIDFYEGFTGIFSATHKFNKVTSMMDLTESSSKEDAKIESTLTDKLKIGDYILDFETDREILKYKSEERMVNDGLKDKLELSMLWVNTLNELYNKFDKNTESMYKELKKAGLTIQISQLKNWIHGETIAPKDSKNLEIIGQVVGGDFGMSLIDRKNEVLSACHTLKQYRFQIAQNRRKAAYSAITKADLSSYGDLGKNVFKFEIREFGTATIYRIEDIDSDYMDYPHNIINKIKMDDY